MGVQGWVGLLSLHRGFALRTQTRLFGGSTLKTKEGWRGCCLVYKNTPTRRETGRASDLLSLGPASSRLSPHAGTTGDSWTCPGCVQPLLGCLPPPPPSLPFCVSAGTGQISWPLGEGSSGTGEEAAAAVVWVGSVCSVPGGWRWALRGPSPSPRADLGQRRSPAQSPPPAHKDPGPAPGLLSRSAPFCSCFSDHAFKHCL